MKNIYAAKLEKHVPHVSCCDCEKEISDSKESEIWTLQGEFFRCRKCSDYEGLY